METPTDIDLDGPSPGERATGLTDRGAGGDGGDHATVDAPAPDVDRRARLSEQLAAAVFGAYIAVAAVLIPFVIGKDRWFLRDEWIFLAGRHDGIGDLFLPFGSNWSTLPVLSYKLMYRVFGLNEYWPYLMLVVILHLTTAVLLRVVMRRLGVGPWIATITAAVLVLFGPGQQNILWAFQIGMTGSMVMGLLQLIAADHDGPIGRRDWLGLLAGLVGLLCSGVSVALVIVVGIAVLIRRGWKPALFQTAPLAVVYLLWWVWQKPTQNLPGSPPIREVLSWITTGTRGTFTAIGHFAVVGALLGIMTVVGLVVAWLPLDRSTFRRRAAVPIALLLGVPIFFVTTAIPRWIWGSEFALSSRYLYISTALILPVLGVAADAVSRRWRLTTPVVMVLLLVGIPFNVGQFEDGVLNSTYLRGQRQLVLGLANSPDADQVPRWVQPIADPYNGTDVTMGWLLDGRRAGRVPAPDEIGPGVRSQIPIRLGVGQSQGTPPAACTRSGAVDLNPKVGDVLGIESPVDVTAVVNQRSVGVPVTFDPSVGETLTITLPNLHLRFSPLKGNVDLMLCRPQP